MASYNLRGFEQGIVERLARYAARRVSRLRLSALPPSERRIYPLRVRNLFQIPVLLACLASCASIPQDEVAHDSNANAVLVLLSSQVLDFDALISLSQKYGKSDVDLEEELRGLAQQKLEDVNGTLRDPNSLQGRRNACDNLVKITQWFSAVFKTCSEAPDGLCNAFENIVLLCQEIEFASAE